MSRQYDRDGHELRSRQRVVYVGMRDDLSIPCRVSRVLKDCVRIRHENGRVEDVHPEGLRLAPPSGIGVVRNTSDRANSPRTGDANAPTDTGFSSCNP